MHAGLRERRADYHEFPGAVRCEKRLGQHAPRLDGPAVGGEYHLACGVGDHQSGELRGSHDALIERLRGQPFAQRRRIDVPFDIHQQPCRRGKGQLGMLGEQRGFGLEIALQGGELALLELARFLEQKATHRRHGQQAEQNQQALGSLPGRWGAWPLGGGRGTLARNRFHVVAVSAKTARH